MADLKTGTTIAGSLIWSKSNLDLVPTGNQLFYKESLIYSENDKPSKADVGLPAVENFGISTQAESVAGVVNDKYLTPLRNQQHFEGKTSTLTRTILGRTSASNIRGDLQLGSIATEEASNYTPVSRTLTAGNGISGGGNLTTNRTFTLGTPSTIGSGSGNTVGASTHSHAISLNSSDIPNLDTAKITSGTLSTDRIPNLAASKITSGEFPYDRLPFSSTQVSNWNTAFSWGNHASVGYLTSETTYTAGTGLTLTGTEFSVDSPFNSSGDYSSLRARSTTFGDVGAVPGNATRINGSGSNSHNHGSISIYGSKSGYSGVAFSDANHVFMIRNSDGLSGLYHNNSTWKWQFNSNGSLAVGTVPWGSVTSKPGIVYTSGSQSVSGTFSVTSGNQINASAFNLNGYKNWDSGGYHSTGGRAAIVNDNGSYNALMILGNASGSTGRREIKMWDNLEVSRNITAGHTIRGTTVRGSDPILKDVQEEVYLTLEEINSLQSVLFKWKYGAKKGTLSYGILADEVEKIAPFLISWADEYTESTLSGDNETIPRHRSVDYDGLSVLIGVSLAKIQYNKWYKRLFRKIKGILWQ